jgi:hypothetical protein
MNFRLRGGHSVILMSVRANAPYQDQVLDDGSTLIYEGHDEPKRAGITNPKGIDQPERTPNGSLTENGKFNQAAQGFKNGQKVQTSFRYTKKSKRGFGSTTDFST